MFIFLNDKCWLFFFSCLLASLLRLSLFCLPFLLLLDLFPSPASVPPLPLKGWPPAACLGLSSLKGRDTEQVHQREVLVTQSCLALCEPMECSLPGSSVHGILQARILEWVAIPFSRGSPRPNGSGLNPHLLHHRQILYHLSHQGSPWSEGRGQPISCLGVMCIGHV